MTARVRIILFDVGGVLVENRGEQMLGERIRDPEEAARLRDTWLESPSLRAFESGRISADAFVDAFLAETGLAIGRSGFIEAFESLPGRLYPDVPALLDALRGRYTLATLSNTNALHWPRVSGELGIGTLIEHHFPSYLTGRLKPEPGAFTQVIEHFGCDPESILFLDDHPINVEAAQAAGMHAARARGAGEVRRELTTRGLL